MQGDHSVCSRAVRAPSSLGLRFLRDSTCLLTPVGSTLPTPQSCGLTDPPHVPGCSAFALAERHPLGQNHREGRWACLGADVTQKGVTSHQLPALGRTGAAPPTPSLLRITFLSLAPCSSFLMAFLTL